jgi:membrane protease YdiL (CAAX protease family)
MEIKNHNRKIILEISILFALFYLPSYLFQNSISDPEAFNDPLFNLQLWTLYIPQISLILYLIGINKDKTFSDFGIKKLKMNEIPSIFLTIAFLILIIGIIQVIFKLFPRTASEEMFLWELHNKKIIPLLLISSFLTGYSEELFFRSYLFTMLEELKLGKIHIILTVNMIFALGHFYEGSAGGINAFILGCYFSLVFLKKRNIHIPAIVHGLYNFSVLLLSLIL